MQTQLIPPGGPVAGTATSLPVVSRNVRDASGVAVLVRAQELTAEAVRSTIDADLRALGIVLDAIV